ncbi:MAG: serine/threonine-protein kinase [Planctomycetota bacterium]
MRAVEPRTRTRWSEVLSDTTTPVRPVPEVELQPGDRLSDRFRLEAPLGRGSFGVIYRAWDELLEERVAIKVLRGSADPRRLRHGNVLLGELAHPRLVRLRALGACRGRHYLVMSYEEGAQDLGRLLSAEGPLPWGEAVALTVDLLEALTYLHGRGLVQRDVKPTNVLRTQRGAVLIDFDLVRSLRPSAARATTRVAGRVAGRLTGRAADRPPARPALAGTPLYMPPERLRGAPASPEGDVYSAALVLHLLGTGHLPCDRPRPPRDVEELAAARDRPLLGVEGAPPALERALRRALAPAPAARFASAGAFRDGLRDVAPSSA